MAEPREHDGPRSGTTDETPDDAATVAIGAAPGGVPSDSDALIGTSLSRYVVLEEIGRGGMGRVLRAYDPKLQREVALKELRSDALGAEASARLVAEARAMAKLSHPNVVSVYDVQESSGGSLVLVMEYVAGPTLKHWLRERGRGWSDVVQRFAQAGRGVAAAHAAGILHRDFKPANVLVAPDGTVKVTDFGLAKSAIVIETMTGQAEPPSLARDEELTEEGVVLGTPRYMAPEQHAGEPLTPAIDQYALCVALWEALCSAPPFSGPRMVADKRQGPPAWPKTGVPRPIVQAITRGLSPDPSERWPSVSALLEALAWDPSRRRNRALLGIAGLCALGLAGAAWQSWTSARANRCTGAPEHLAGVWDDAQRNAIEQAFLATGESYAAGTWAWVEQELDAYAETWTAMHTETCEATTVRGEQSAAVMDLRMACLQREKVELRAVTEQLADADAEVVRHAHDLAAGLRPLARCADIEALQQDVEPPLPSEAEVVDTIRTLLAESRAADRAGRYAEAKKKLDAVQSAAADLDYGPIRTEVALAEGDVFDHLGD